MQTIRNFGPILNIYGISRGFFMNVPQYKISLKSVHWVPDGHDATNRLYSQLCEYA